MIVVRTRSVDACLYRVSHSLRECELLASTAAVQLDFWHVFEGSAKHLKFVRSCQHFPKRQESRQSS